MTFWRGEQFKRDFHMYPGLQNLSHHGIQASCSGWDFGKLRNSRNLLIPFQRYCWEAFCLMNNILEESQGLNSCCVVSDNIIHIHEDVLNFSSPDNYWCYNFERADKRFVSISSKGLCNNYLEGGGGVLKLAK